jgi:hypothetical protein
MVLVAETLTHGDCEQEYGARKADDEGVVARRVDVRCVAHVADWLRPESGD